MEHCIIIPAYEPEAGFLPYLDELLCANLGPVLVVDDGSGPDWAALFREVGEKENCTVLTHPANRGKGAAIKTALAHYREYCPDCAGAVTVDCDGQHTVPDVEKVCAATHGNTLVLGCRTFGEETPSRSMTGNRVTSAAMRALYNIDLEDTQTGLRGIPDALVPGAQALRGERYEYELNMLIYAKQRCIPFTVVPIATVYFNGNAGSHYRTVRDSARIVGQLLRGMAQYILNAGVSAMADVALYALLAKMLLTGLPVAQRLFLAALGARVVSSFINYAANRNLPTAQNRSVPATLPRYYILWAVQLMLSFGIVWAFHTGFGFDELPVKIVTDLLLGLLSYQVQMRWVFRGSGVECEM